MQAGYNDGSTDLETAIKEYCMLIEQAGIIALMQYKYLTTDIYI